jgi:serine/threonine-protein kinase
VGWGWHHLHAGSGRAPAAAGAGADETTKPGAPLRIAVLPFENVGDTANAYLADGMADELTTMLAHLPGLQVAARSSVARFRDRAAPAQTVARALNVGAVLEGTVRRTGDRLRISAQLTNGRDGMILWADQFERPVTDVFALQDEIASAITGALHERIGPGGAPGASPGTADLEAYDQYLKGRFAWSKRGRRGLTEAIRHFEAAVARDPAFARGYTGLAMAYVVLPIFDAAMPGDTALARAERYAGRALALDSTLSDAHLALAYVLKSRWRFPEAERHFRNALALAPDDPAVRHWYGVQLYAVGRIHESVEQLTRARALDPFNATIATDGAVALYGAGRFAEAVASARAALALDSTLPDARFVTGIAQLALGHPDSALEAFATAQRFGMGMDMRGYRSAALRRLGRTHEADAVEAELRRAAASDGSAAHQLALAAAAHGDAPTALAAVERTIDQRPMFVTELTLPCEPILASLERQPRFRAALARGGLAVCDRAAPASHEPGGLP